MLLLTACARHVPSAPAAPHAPSAAPQPTRELTSAVHDVLAQHCGQCHEGSRASAVPAALAVFDLDRRDWPARFDSRHRFDVALQRLSGSPGTDKALFVAFRDSRLPL